MTRGSFALHTGLAAVLQKAHQLTLLIIDNSGTDSGFIEGWSFVVNNPTPGALALLGVAGLFGSRRRR